MPDTPNNHISADGAEPHGKLPRLGLNTVTATLQDCMRGMVYVTDGHVHLEQRNGRIAAIGDASEEAQAIGFYLTRMVADPDLSQLPPIARLATIINHFASLMDGHDPITMPDMPSRMEALAELQSFPAPTRKF